VNRNWPEPDMKGTALGKCRSSLATATAILNQRPLGGFETTSAVAPYRDTLAAKRRQTIVS
jgi:hypothetical protein